MRYSPQPEKETDSKGIRKAYDVFKNRHTARFTSIPHTHTYYEAVLILEGHLTYETMEPAIIRLNPGDVLFCPPNVVHDSYIAENDSIMSSMVVKFSPLFLYPTETTQSDVECLVMPPVFNKPCYVFRESSEQALLLGHLIQQIYREYQEKKLGWELALRGGMTALYVHLVRLCGTVGNVPLPEEHETDEYSAQKLHRILRYLEDNYSYAISMQEVADACEMNYYQFSRFFKRVTNKKFNEYLLAGNGSGL